MSPFRRIWISLSAKGRRFARAKAGVSAVEFALVLPILLTLFFGTVEVTQSVMVNRLVVLTSSTTANLVSQYTAISASNDLPDIFNASAQIMNPYPTSSLAVIISCIGIDSTGKATVSWSKAQNTNPHTAGAAIAVPSQLATPSTSLILTEVAYLYSPPTNFLALGPYSIKSNIYMVPRNTSTITLTP